MGSGIDILIIGGPPVPAVTDIAEERLFQVEPSLFRVDSVVGLDDTGVRVPVYRQDHAVPVIPVSPVPADPVRARSPLVEGLITMGSRRSFRIPQRVVNDLGV